MAAGGTRCECFAASPPSVAVMDYGCSFLNIIFWVKKKDSLGEKLWLRLHCSLPRDTHQQDMHREEPAAQCSFLSFTFYLLWLT